MGRLHQTAEAYLFQDGAEYLWQDEGSADPSGREFSVVFERHLDPIKHRGKIVLTDPLADGERIEIFRKTPIETTFNAVALQPFPVEELEYTLDKICFIQQEIEGHLCACPPYPDYPEEPPEGPPDDAAFPECLGYDCAALVKYARDAGYKVTDFTDEQAIGVGGLIPAQIPFDDGDGAVSYLTVDSAYQGSGETFLLDDNLAPLHLWTLEGWDLCDNRVLSLALGQSPAEATPQPKLYLPAAAAADGVAFAHYQGISSAHATRMLAIRRLEWTWTATGPGTVTSAVDVGMGWNNPNQLENYRTSAVADTVFFAGAGEPNLTAFAIELVQVYSEDVGGGFGRLRAHVRSTMTINGTAHVINDDFTISGSYNPPPELVSCELTGALRMFQGMRMELYAGIALEPGWDYDLLLAYFNQNSADYGIPEYCDFTGGEI